MNKFAKKLNELVSVRNNNLKWHMYFSIGNSNYSPPVELQSFYKSHGNDTHEISGTGTLTKEILDSISNNIGNRIFCHLDMNNNTSYVWSSRSISKDPIIVETKDVILYFEYDL